jgi:putative phosphoribosyl transferase
MEHHVKIRANGLELKGILNLPPASEGLVLFVPSSRSSRLSPRTAFVAGSLNKAKLATLLVDILSEEEDSNYETRFDVHLLSNRVLAIIHWLHHHSGTRHLPIGLFGASKGAAVALFAAAELGNRVKAVVSRGGRIDMAMEVIPHLKAPTLLLCGGEDYKLLEFNQKAFERLSCDKKFNIISRATHLFEEPGAIEQVSELTREWFALHMTRQEIAEEMLV